MSTENQSATTHVIFDYNGTIINVRKTMNKMLALNAERMDVNSVQSQLSSSKCSKFFNKIINFYQGKIPEVGVHEIIKLYYDALHSPSLIDYEKFAKEFVDTTLEVGFELLPGVDRLLNHLNKNNIPIAIASNTNKNLLEREIKTTFGLNKNHISHYVCGDDTEVKANKPATDVYMVCAKRFDPAPLSMDSCAIFEDSLLGITGAVNTGMKTVLIGDQSIIKSNEIADKITVIVDSFDNFKPESVGLPPY